MLFISETCRGLKPIPYTRPHSQGCASGTSTITGNSKELREGGLAKCRWLSQCWLKNRLLPSVSGPGPATPGLGICWHFIIMETAFAPKNNHLQSPHFGESLGLFSGTTEWTARSSRSSTCGPLFRNEMHGTAWLLAAKPTWKLFQAQ